MSETLGSLVDKLSIVNIKLYHVQDEVYAAEQAGDGLEAETVRKLAYLNRQRNKLATEIDVMFASDKREVDERLKLE